MYFDSLQYFFEPEGGKQCWPHKPCLQHLAVLTTPKHVKKTHTHIKQHFDINRDQLPLNC